MILRARGTVLGFPGRCCVVLSHALAFWLGIIEKITAFITRYGAVKQIVAFDSTPFRHARRNFSTALTSLQHLPDRSAPYSNQLRHFPRWHTPISSGELNDFSVVSVGRGNSLATTARLIGDVCIPVFKMLYPSSDVVSAHADVSVSTSKSCVNIGCGYFVCLNKYCNDCRLPKRHNLPNHFSHGNMAT